MDQQKLRNLVFEKTGVKVDTNDPIFALVALNEAVLAETVERHLALIDAASAELAQQARNLAHGHPDERPAAAHAAPPYAAVPTPAAPLAKAIPTQSPTLLAPRELRLLAAAAGVSLLTALIVVGAQALLRQPAAPVPAPAPVVQALALTPAQTAALANAEKLTRAVQKLDPKSRALIQAELQKP